MLLSESEIEHYQEAGFVKPSFRLDASLIAEIADAHSRLIARHSEFTDYCSCLLAYDTWFLNVAREPVILDCVEQILGPDFALWNASFFAKPAMTGSRTPWHQDGEYWPISPLATCTVWIAIDASTIDNGCLRVIPQSHQSKSLAAHHLNNAAGLALDLELDPAEYDATNAVEIELESGEISLHDVFLYHGSEPNRSANSRRGMTLRFMPTSSVYEHAKGRAGASMRQSMSQRTVYLMRGVDASGRNDFRMRY